MDLKDDTDKYLHKLEKKICGKLKKSDKNQKSLKALLECLRKERKKAAKELSRDANLNEDAVKMIADAQSVAINQRKRDERLKKISDYISKNKLTEDETAAKIKRKLEQKLKRNQDIEIMDNSSLLRVMEETVSSRELEDRARLRDSLERRKMFEAFAREGKKSAEHPSPVPAAPPPPNISDCDREDVGPGASGGDYSRQRRHTQEWRRRPGQGHQHHPGFYNRNRGQGGWRVNYSRRENSYRGAPFRDRDRALDDDSSMRGEDREVPSRGALEWDWSGRYKELEKNQEYACEFEDGELSEDEPDDEEATGCRKAWQV